MESVIVDFRDGYIICGSFYVAITRVRDGNNLFLRDFSPDYIKVSSQVNETIKTMKENMPYMFLKTYLSHPCFKLDQNDFKIGYLNINGLKNADHDKYVNSDKNLSNLSLLCLSDTRLTDRDSSYSISEAFSNWDIVWRKDCDDGKRHMGLLFLTPKAYEKDKHAQEVEFFDEEDVKRNNLESVIQTVHVKHNEEVISLIYCKETPNKQEVGALSKLTKSSHYILGDLNLDPKEKNDKMKIHQFFEQ